MQSVGDTKMKIDLGRMTSRNSHVFGIKKLDRRCSIHPPAGQRQRLVFDHLQQGSAG